MCLPSYISLVCCFSGHVLFCSSCVWKADDLSRSAWAWQLGGRRACFYQAVVPSFINSVSIPEQCITREERKQRERHENSKGEKQRKKVGGKTEGRVQKIIHAPEPSRRGPLLAAEVVVTPHAHTWPESSTHTPRKLFSRLHKHTLCSNPQQAGPRSTPVAKKTGSAADTCAEERKSKHSQLPLPRSSPSKCCWCCCFYSPRSFCKSFNIS